MNLLFVYTYIFEYAALIGGLVHRPGAAKQIQHASIDRKHALTQTGLE